jgi:hypothetical protein
MTLEELKAEVARRVLPGEGYCCDSFDHPATWCWKCIARLLVERTEPAYSKTDAKPTITLRDGTVLKPDDISYILFNEDDTVDVKGWKTGLNQTLDTFKHEDLLVIHLARSEKPHA